MGGMAARVVSVLVLAVVGALAFVDGGPPSPVPASAGPGEFSGQRASATVAELAREPRPIGSPASDRVRDELVRRLDAAGLDTRIHSSAGAFAKNGSASAGAVENVVATLPGTDPTGAVVLAAHYDSVAHGPGAADDMSSVASILEAVRALRTGPPLRNDLVVLLTDGEESGLLGAQAWVRDELRADRRPVVTLNFEARGVSGPSLMFQTSPGNGELVRTYAGALPHPTGDSSLVEFYRLLPNDTDFTNVLQAGRPGLNFAFIDGPVEYHTSGDNPSNLDAGSVQGHGDAALGLTRALGGRDLAPLDPGAGGAARTDDRTYFRFLGGMLTYPNGVVWPVAVIAAVALGGAVLLGRRRGLVSVRGTLAAAGATLLAAGVGLCAAIGLWQLITLARPSYADTGPFLARPLLFQLADVALAVAVVALWLLLLRRRPGRWAAAAGACLVFTVLGLVTAFAAPGMSFLFAWPALGLALGLCAAIVLRGRRAAATAAVTIGAVPAVVLLVPFGWAAFALSGIADGLPVVVLVLTLAALTAVLVPTAPPDRRRRWVPVAALALTVVLAGAAMLADRPSPEHPQATSLAFVQDADNGVATWVSEDTAPADWTARYVSSPPTEVPAWTDAPVLTGPAPALPVPGPAVTVVERTPQRLVLQVASPRRAPTIQMRSDRPLGSVTVAYPGRPAASASPDGDAVRLGAVPPAGVRVTLTPVDPGPVGLQVSDVSDGLGAVPGFVPRPPELRAEADRAGDQVLVTRRIPG